MVMNRVLLEKAVAGHPFARGMSMAHLEALTDCAMFLEFRAGETIFNEGDISNRFYLIQSGRISLETEGEDGSIIVLQSLGAGDVLGWSWLFPPYYWHFTACASEPTQAIFFYGTRLRERCEEDREFGYELMRRVTSVVMKRLQVTLQESLRLARERPA
jgi:CRP/FNR family cyclic AMP-dependent transcriptional regulator